jgi:putative hydrolase
MPPRTRSLDERSHRAEPAPGGPGAAGADHRAAPPDNEHLATALEEMAALLAAQHANPFRTAAYRDAAGVLRALDRPAADILAAEGAAGLTRLPKIGQSLARTIEHLVAAGTTPLLEHLRGVADPERTLCAAPGIGPQLAARVHDRLGVETLADLEAAAWDGRLATVPGFGRKRVRGIRESTAGTAGRTRAFAAPALSDQPPVAELLDVDREYRRRAANDHLLRIAPYRFNPTRAAWLPILHTSRGDRHYTALYSNTARAHALGTTRDWVVIYRDDPAGHGQWTVITARLGPLHGQRIVRGREQECVRHYDDARAAVEWGRRLL